MATRCVCENHLQCQKCPVKKCIMPKCLILTSNVICKFHPKIDFNSIEMAVPTDAVEFVYSENIGSGPCKNCFGTEWHFYLCKKCKYHKCYAANCKTLVSPNHCFCREHEKHLCAETDCPNTIVHRGSLYCEKH